MGRITSFSKQVIVFFLVTSLIIRPTFAANFGGWSLGGGVAQGASTVYDGTKKVIIDGKDYIKKGTAIVTPTATNVAKVLARGAAGYALSVAVEQLLGAVDWVLDPANNQITYTEKSKPANEDPTIPRIWAAGAGVQSDYIYSSADAAGRAVCSYYGQTFNSNYTWSGKDQGLSLSQAGSAYTWCVRPDGSRDNWDVKSIPNPLYDPNAVPEDKPKSIPLETVAQKVISNAESGDTNAQVATAAAAADIVAEAQQDSAKARPIVQQLEASAQTKPADESAAEKANEATGEAKPNTANPDSTDLSITFPIFCNWAPTVCEAAQTVISFPQTLANWWETGKSKSEEWATSISESWSKVKEQYNEKPKQNTDTQLDIPDPTLPDINTDINFGGSCPASRSVPVSFSGISTEIEFSFQWFCEIASIAKPVIISISAFAAALIVAGVRTEDD